MSVATKSTGQFLHAAKNLQKETRPLPALEPEDVQVAIRSTTLCGSDLHYYSHFKNGSILVREPLCLGHESAGEIVALGSRVHEANPSLKLGDKVALEVGVPCTKCDLCQAGRYNICPELRFRSSGSKFPHYQGTLQECVNHPAKWATKLPPSLDYEVGALLEPLAVAIQAVHRAERCTYPYSLESVLIFGAGAVGLLTAVAARAAGAENIIMADIHQGRLSFAKENGFASATYSVQPKRAESPDEMIMIAKATAQEIGEVMWPNGKPVSRVNMVFECTGVSSCVQASVFATKSGGSVVTAGLGTPNLLLPISEATAREITIVPTWRYANAYPEALRIAEESVSGKVTKNGLKLPDIRQLVTHRFNGLDSIETAFQTAGASGDENGQLVIKTVVNFP